MTLSFSLSFWANSDWVIPFFSRALRMSLANSATMVSTGSEAAVFAGALALREAIGCGLLMTRPSFEHGSQTESLLPSIMANTRLVSFPQMSHPISVNSRESV